MYRMLSVWLVLALATVAGCAQDSETETALAVSVKTDLVVGQELSSVWIRVFAADADPKTAVPLQDFEPQPANALDKVTLLKKGGVNELLIAVQGLGLAGRGEPVVEHHVRARFSPGRTMVVPVYLAKACVQKACGGMPGQTCVGGPSPGGGCGTCAPIPEAAVIEAEESREVTASWQPAACGAPPPQPTPLPELCDGGVPGGLSDGGMCPAPCTPSALPGSTCNLVEKCGCPEGRSCTPKETAGGAFVAECQLNDGRTRRERETCSATQLCAPGLHCMGTTHPVCRPYCATDEDCGGTKGSCLEMTSSSRPSGISVCFPTCTSNADCETACCAPNGICAPAGLCSDPTPPPPNTSCRSANQACTVSTECCDAAPYCATNSTGQRTCATAIVVTPALCQSPAGAMPCETCQGSSCCTEITNCRGQPACQRVLNCENRCPSGSAGRACRSACKSADAIGGPLSAAWDACIESSCTTQCGG